MMVEILVLVLERVWMSKQRSLMMRISMHKLV